MSTMRLDLPTNPLAAHSAGLLDYLTRATAEEPAPCPPRTIGWAYRAGWRSARRAMEDGK